MNWKFWTRSKLKVMGPNYVPSTQTGQLDVATIRAAVKQLKASAPVPTWTAGLFLGSSPMPKDLPKSTSTEPILAYRVWKLDRETCRLKSTAYNQYEWPFRRRLCRDSIDNGGIHAVKQISRVMSGKYTMQDPAGGGLWDEYTADVAGEVYLWGEVHEFQLGYKAEFAYPKTLWMPEDTDPMLVIRLEENYGVPVELRKEFKKHQPAIASNKQQFMMSPRQIFYQYVQATIPCPYCGIPYDPFLSLVGCPNSACPSSLSAMLNTANTYPWGSGAAQLGIQNSFGVAQGTPTPPASSGQQAIVPYKPPKP